MPLRTSKGLCMWDCPYKPSCNVGAILYGCPHPKAVRYGIEVKPGEDRGGFDTKTHRFHLRLFTFNPFRVEFTILFKKNST